MFSSDNNIQNHLAKGEIELLRELDLSNNVPMHRCDKKEYDLIQTKDPNIIYITNKGIFLGESEITSFSNHQIKENGLRYYLTFDGRNYIIFYKYIFKFNTWDKLYEEEKVTWASELIEINRFDDPDKAIRVLNILNKIGHHDAKSLNLYELINDFLNKDIFINDFAIGVISEVKGNEDPRLQEIINLATAYGANDARQDLSKVFKTELVYLKEECERKNKDSFIPLYLELTFYAHQYFTMYKEWTSEYRRNMIKKEFLNRILDIFQFKG